MRLIFKEEIEFLHEELGINIPLKCCWMNRMCIKVIDEKDKWHTLYRIKAENMQLTLTKDNSKILDNIKIKTWNDLIKDNAKHLKELEIKTMCTIRDYIRQYKGYKVVVPVSGGKDSSLTDYFVKGSVEKYSMNKEVFNIFSNTTNETHHTYKFIKQNYKNLKIITPKNGFYQWVKDTGFVPTRFGRACCSVFKETEMIKQMKDKNDLLFFMGMRRAESKNRSEYETEWRNIRWTNESWQGVLPILKFSDMDVWLYMLYKNIPINPLYKLGYGRVGCTNCPFRSDYELILNKEFLLKYHNRWQTILENDFIKNQKWMNLNCTINEYKQGAWKSGLLRDEPNDEVIKEFIAYNNLDESIAKNYFNHYCRECDKEYNNGNRKKRKKIKDKEILAMNMKLLGRNTENFLCKKHLMEYLNINKEQWDEYVKDFKEQGCNLF